MQDSESTEDIYNSLPVDLFTNSIQHSKFNLNFKYRFLDYDEFETDSLGSEIDDYTSELLNDSINEGPSQESPIASESNIALSEDEAEIILENFRKLNLEPKIENINITKKEAILSKNNSPIKEESCSMWIRCVRCGKKNEIDCNFCGKCGLQIHKTVSIVEPEAEETSSPEVARNIKYHYKRPVFCFAPRGNYLQIIFHKIINIF